MIPNWDVYFLNLCQVIKTRSKDLNTQVGCVIVSPLNNVVSTGYNGFPRGIDDSVIERYERPTKYEWTCHSEENAICAAARIGNALDGCKIYCSILPCMTCSRMIRQSGILEVIYNKNENDKWDSPKYKKQRQDINQLFKESNIIVRPVIL